MKKRIALGTSLLFGLGLTAPAEASISKIYPESKKITVTSDHARLFSSSNLKSFKTPKQGTVYQVNGYRNINGRHYYRLYQTDSNNKAVYRGYIHHGYTRELKFNSTSGYYKVKPSANVWKNFYYSRKQPVVNKEQATYIKGYYILGNNSKYYSLYQKDSHGKATWVGYTHSSNIIPFNATNKSEKITLKKSISTKQNFFMKQNKNSFSFNDNVTFESKLYYTLNNQKIYSLYRPNKDKKQEWVGYVYANEVTTLNPLKYNSNSYYRVKNSQQYYYRNFYWNSRYTAKHTLNPDNFYQVKYIYKIGNSTFASLYNKSQFINTESHPTAGQWVGYMDFKALESDLERANTEDRNALKQAIDKAKALEKDKNSLESNSYKKVTDQYRLGVNALNQSTSNIRTVTTITAKLNYYISHLQFNKQPLLDAIQAGKNDLNNSAYTSESKTALRQAVSDAQNFLNHASSKDLHYTNKKVADQYISKIKEAQKKLVKVETSDIANDAGLLIDIARHPMTASEIIQIINEVDTNTFDYIQLHLSDNEHVSFQSEVLGNTASKYVLSHQQLQEIMAAANRRGLYIVPDVDFPSHAQAALKLIKRKDPELYFMIVKDAQTIDYTSPLAADFAKKVYKEVTSIFANQKQRYIMIGADEVPDSGFFPYAFTQYLNDINAANRANGFKTIVWNDAISKRALPLLNQDIIINYWSQSGDHDAFDELKFRFGNSISVSDVLNTRHSIINANSYSNYYMMHNIGDTHSENFFLDYLRNDYEANEFHQILSSFENVFDRPEKEVTTTGTLVALWGEDSSDISINSIKEFASKIRI